MAARVPALLVLLSLLAACGGPARTAPQVAAAPDAPKAAAATSTPKPDSPPGEATLVAAIAADPGKLKGMSPNQVRTVLGAPSLIRRDYPAEVWQYAGKGCVVDLYLYDEGGAQKVAHVQTRRQAPVSQTQCLADLMAGKREG